MGGYGALKIALKEYGRYCAAFGLSSVADINNIGFEDVLLPVFGGEIPKSDDLFCLAEEHNSDDIKPRIYMTIGTEDFMYEDNIRLSKHFDTLNYDFKFVQTDGAHSWDLWDRTVQSAMKWMMKQAD